MRGILIRYYYAGSSSYLGKAKRELWNRSGHGEITGEIECEVEGEMGEEVGW